MPATWDRRDFLRIGGGVLAAIIFLLTRRNRSADGTLLSKIELLEHGHHYGENF